jgi:NAD-dependent deacetylase
MVPKRGEVEQRKPSGEPHRQKIREAARWIRGAGYLTAFTGAGVSVESGVPPFRGPGGLWSRYDPRHLELSYFLSHPDHCWKVLREIFYTSLSEARPNEAHRTLARLEQRGLLKAVITQNIDFLHQAAGSANVLELHGNYRTLICLKCRSRSPAAENDLGQLPPRCGCGGLFKPDMVFFGEELPETAWVGSLQAARKSDVMLVIGSTGEVYPAASIPAQAAEEGSIIIEINPEPSAFSRRVTDLLIPLPAGEALPRIEEALEP